MPAPKQRFLVPISVSMSKESMAALVPPDTNAQPADVIGARCTEYLKQTAEGGLMLSGEEVAAIEANVSKGIRSGQDVVRATMAKAGLTEAGMVKIEAHLDPSWTGPLEQLARESGRSVGDLVREIYEMALENNWLYGFNFAGSRHTISPQAESFFAKRIEGALSIDKIVAYIRKVEKVAEPELVTH